MSEKRTHIIKKGLFGIILIGLFIPLLQQMITLKEEEPLKGAVHITPYQSFTWETWFDGSYQENNTKFCNDNFGFRTSLIRLNNQKHFTLFNRARANGVAIGKENYLYETDYIRSYYGLDQLPKDSIDRISSRLAYISKTLNEKDKKLIVLIAPGKGSFFPEYIPDRFISESKRKTNYELYKKTFKKNGIEVIDFNSWFLSMKETAKYPLFPKCGIHWSKYGEYLAADSLIHYLEYTTGKNLPDLVLDTIVVQDENINGDYDIGEGMNLLFPLDTYPMAYPYYKFEENTDSLSPKVLVVADSYYWGMFNIGMSRDCFNDGQFWFYSKQIYPDSYETPVSTKDIDATKKIEEHDVVILLTTEANLYKFPFGFLDLLKEY